MRTKRGHLVKACYNNGVSHHLLCLTVTQRQTGIIRNPGGCQCYSVWKLLIWEAGGGLSRMGGVTFVIDSRACLTFFNQNELKVGPKSREVGSH